MLQNYWSHHHDIWVFYHIYKTYDLFENTHKLENFSFFEVKTCDDILRSCHIRSDENLEKVTMELRNKWLPLLSYYIRASNYNIALTFWIIINFPFRNRWIRWLLVTDRLRAINTNFYLIKFKRYSVTKLNSFLYLRSKKIE